MLDPNPGRLLAAKGLAQHDELHEPAQSVAFLRDLGEDAIDIRAIERLHAPAAGIAEQLLREHPREGRLPRNEHLLQSSNIAETLAAWQLTHSRFGKLLVATLKQGHMVEIFDLATGKSLARLKTSNEIAHGVTITPDSRYAFVSSEGRGSAPGRVDVIDLQTRAIAGTVNVGQQASGITFWKMSGR